MKNNFNRRTWNNAVIKICLEPEIAPRTGAQKKLMPWMS